MVQSREGSFRNGSILGRDWRVAEQYIRRLDVKIIGSVLWRFRVIGLLRLQLAGGQGNR